MDKKLLILISIFFVTFGTFVTIVATKSDKANPGPIKAKQPQQIPDLANCLIFSVPDPEGCNITVVVKDAANMPIKDIMVCPETTSGSLLPQCQDSDESGIATVKLRNLSQNADIKAKINDQYLSKTVHCYKTSQ